MDTILLKQKANKKETLKNIRCEYLNFIKLVTLDPG